jgi:hypothetical protein
MAKVRIAFEIMLDGMDLPPTFQEVRSHLVFDVKMEDFRERLALLQGVT